MKKKKPTTHRKLENAGLSLPEIRLLGGFRGLDESLQIHLMVLVHGLTLARERAEAAEKGGA